ncbi:radical SAM protein [candidate division TA06 bacterium DG_78]|uniref:Radical SAM protein n=1 Tax=candidate division TA06 bacterium DG_78 TaxID=1703772 RepID=A0A0S7YBS1_UNCT6|nr:MAG: radical SAM protein [candidate division TA06 bacterium DG_78]
MRIINSFGKDELAKVYIAEFDDGSIVEFVESLQPPIPRQDKWVLIISTSFGCPVRCIICDAGGSYRGKLSVTQMLEQVDFLVSNRYPDQKIPAKKFKIQFARMGEPSFNEHVIEVLRKLPFRYEAPGLLPCISTIAPSGTDDFFDELVTIKKDIYCQGKFQLQFSVHSTDEKIRDTLMPVPKWSLAKIAEYGSQFYQTGDRKIALNFALGQNIPLNPHTMHEIFPPDYFMIKITPVNPTYAAVKHSIKTFISSTAVEMQYEVVEALRTYGFDTLISIGENEENLIGSNCGQYVMRHYQQEEHIPDSYTYVGESKKITSETA